MKKTIRQNWRIEIVPWLLGYNEQKTAEKFIEAFTLACKRRDDESSLAFFNDYLKNADMKIVYDEKEICEFCGREWEEQETDDDPNIPLGQPFCCGKAIEEFDLRRAGKIEGKS